MPKLSIQALLKELGTQYLLFNFLLAKLLFGEQTSWGGISVVNHNHYWIHTKPLHPWTQHLIINVGIINVGGH